MTVTLRDYTFLGATQSLCPECLAHVPAAVFEREGRVLIRKRCTTHGDAQGVLENDARWYRLSNKDRWGRCYRPERVVDFPAFDGGCCGPGESCDTPVDAVFLVPSDEQAFRLGLVTATKNVIARSLDLIVVEAPDRM